MTLIQKQLQFESSAEAWRKTATRHLRCKKLKPHEIDDIIQSALLTAWEQLDSWQEASALTTWFMGIVNNKSQEFLRNRKLETSEIPETSAEASLLTPQEKSLALREFLESQPPKHREVISRYLAGESFVEIGRAFGHSRGWAKEIYRRGLEAWK